MDRNTGLGGITLETPLGSALLLCDEKGLRHLFFEEEGWPAHVLCPDLPLLQRAKKDLGEWFSGKRRDFDLPLAPEGTRFQQQVWEALCRIPYGETRSYGEIAEALAKPGAARAVGQANGKNPLPILIPCHRVIAADGGMGGYSGGVWRKAFLLKLENPQRF